MSMVQIGEKVAPPIEGLAYAGYRKEVGGDIIVFYAPGIKIREVCIHVSVNGTVHWTHQVEPGDDEVDKINHDRLTLQHQLDNATKKIEELREMAEIGEQAMRDQWYRTEGRLDYGLECCHRWSYVNDVEHAPDCKVGKMEARIAQEELDDQ